MDSDNCLRGVKGQGHISITSGKYVANKDMQWYSSITSSDHWELIQNRGPSIKFLDHLKTEDWQDNWPHIAICHQSINSTIGKIQSIIGNTHPLMKKK